MAFTVVDWATHAAPVATTYERIILMILADRANMDGTGAYRSKRTLAEAALCDQKTVQKYLTKMRKRGLIAYGDQSLVKNIKPQYRPNVYDVLMPYSAYPGWALEKANQERVEKGLDPLSEVTRPDIAPPESGRKPRSDKGAERPERRKKKPAGDAAPSDDYQGGMTVPPSSEQPGGNDSPRQGGMTVPARGDSQSPLGGTGTPPNLSGGTGPTEPAPGTGPPQRETSSVPSTATDSSASAREDGYPIQPCDGDGMNEESSDEENNPAELAGRFLADLAQSDSAQHLVQPNAEQKHYLMELVQAAWKLGVSNAELRAELTRSISTCTYMTVWVNRLEQYVHQTETRRKAEQQTADQFPACDTCLAERGFGDFHRKVFRDALDPTSELLPCPDCSPAQHRQWITEMA